MEELQEEFLFWSGSNSFLPAAVEAAPTPHLCTRSVCCSFSLLPAPTPATVQSSAKRHQRTSGENPHCAPATHKFKSKCKVLTGVARKVTTDSATPSSPRLLLLQTFRFRAHMGAVQEGCLIWSCSFHLLPSFSLVLSSCVSAFFPSSNFPLWALLTLSSWLSTAQP